ncbi:hypothetical protein O181_074075 [Austropuccinia psidii MF-1]|uniref:Integrase zinc-binding domain-containing protein n=1 Tax=Austropuccinia psidii MF-1 TaxID=1389203 RepID=A0A9Q3F3U5_9BASI|nr:hypothetical protein [Austropuccinia psidii MF-1]
MTIVYKSGNIHKNADGFSRWALENKPESPAWVPQEEHHIEGICVTDFGTELPYIIPTSNERLTKHTGVMALTDRNLIETILHEIHDSVSAGHLSEDRRQERVKTSSWWPNWKKDVTEYFQTCDRCQKENRDTGKKFGMMIKI